MSVFIKRWMMMVLLVLFIACATSNKKVKNRKRRSDIPYQNIERQSDISYYKERSPGAQRIGQRGFIPRGMTNAAVDGRLLREQDQLGEDGSLWTEGSQQNYLFTKNYSKNIGDIIYINLKEDIRSMLKRDQKKIRDRRAAFRRALLLKRLQAQKTKTKRKGKPVARKPAAGNKAKQDKTTNKKLRKNVYIAARVIDRLSNGTLLIEGHKIVEVNKTTRQILLSGYINEMDINSRNEVDSRKMADLNIDYVVVNKGSK